MKLSDYVIDRLVREGVRHLFEMSGGAITHLLDSVHARDDIDCVSMHHEQAAAFAAEGYARLNGSLGIAMGTSGPGALNLLTGLGSCYFDSVPCLFLTGQVNTYEFKFDQPIRQLGFQETDIVKIAGPISKWATLVTEPDRIRYVLEKAIFLARSGRPGPVLIDLPLNLQRAEVDPDAMPFFLGSPEHAALAGFPPALADEDVRAAADLLRAAERPLLLIGGGVRGSGAAEALAALVRETGLPSVSSLLGLDAAPADSPRHDGLIGSYGHRYANMAVANCDCLLVLGSRLDSRQTGTRPDTFARAARIVHVEIDAAELNRKVRADVAIRADVRTFLERLRAELASTPLNRDYNAWYAKLAENRDRYPTVPPPRDVDASIDPNRFMARLADLSAPGDVVCLDVGQHQMWASQSFRLKRGQRLLNAGGMGAMGFGLPAAIGAALASGRRVLCIAGDGGLQVNVQEMETAVRLGLPIKLFVMNNRHLGMVRQFQDLYFGGRRQSTLQGYGCPDFVRIAEAYGWSAARIGDSRSADAVVAAALAENGPVLVEVELPVDTAVNPKLVVGHPIEDMYPFLEFEQLRQALLIEPLARPAGEAGAASDGE